MSKRETILFIRLAPQTGYATMHSQPKEFIMRFLSYPQSNHAKEMGQFSQTSKILVLLLVKIILPQRRKYFLKEKGKYVFMVFRYTRVI